MKKYGQWKNFLIGIIDKNHPHSKEISKALDETFASACHMINDVTSAPNHKR